MKIRMLSLTVGSILILITCPVMSADYQLYPEGIILEPAPHQGEGGEFYLVGEQLGFAYAGFRIFSTSSRRVQAVHRIIICVLDLRDGVTQGFVNSEYREVIWAVEALGEQYNATGAIKISNHIFDENDVGMHVASCRFDYFDSWVGEWRTLMEVQRPYEVREEGGGNNWVDWKGFYATLETALCSPE